MFGLSKILRVGEGRAVKRLKKIADEVIALEPEYADLSDEELKAKTAEFKKRLKKGETLDDILLEAFAVAREASWRVLDQKHYPVQIMGGAALHFGNVAEMRTGEGKTLTCVLPAYLNALEGKGVHVVTVNDYLAKRDSEWMGRVHRFLGLTTDVILADMTPQERRDAYNADITYGTNNELGFDYLRDNMARSIDELVQRPHNYAIVDEVDSILIDEARTPLIISGPADGSSQWYTVFAQIVPRMTRDVHYEVDERKRTVGVKEEGVNFVEDQLGIENLYAPEHSQLVSYLNNAIKAEELFTRDKDYIIRGGEVLIVDEFTGRVLAGRRYNEGMHQAIEAKEGVEIKNENQTLATITLQNYFRLYNKLAGMTGTAETEAAELHQIYKLDVVTIPTNRPNQREDLTDLVYKTQEAKFAAVVDDIVERVAKNQPVLVGTTSVERSEYLSQLLQRRGVKHHVLNAKHHEQEAEIVAQAGLPGAVTVATNMAGRGTDIKLTDEVKAAGGLAIIGTERHESRRVDRQLRGRAGRETADQQPRKTANPARLRHPHCRARAVGGGRESRKSRLSAHQSRKTQPFDTGLMGHGRFSFGFCRAGCLAAFLYFLFGSARVRLGRVLPCVPHRAGKAAQCAGCFSKLGRLQPVPCAVFVRGYRCALVVRRQCLCTGAIARILVQRTGQHHRCRLLSVRQRPRQTPRRHHAGKPRRVGARIPAVFLTQKQPAPPFSRCRLLFQVRAMREI